MNKDFTLTPQERTLVFLGLLARERELQISISDSKKYGLVNYENLQQELKECLTLQKRIG